MNWIKTTDSLPDSGERVLVYWLELGDLHQAHVCEYFRKGDVVSDEVVPVGDSPMARLLDAMFGKRGERTIEQDGFYIYDSVDDTGLCRWRRHSDVITHWARIVPPEEGNGRDRRMEPPQTRKERGVMCDRYRDGKCISRYCYYLSAGGTCLNPKMKPKPTNADRIRSMNDEELARFLGDEPPYLSTYDKYLEWLRQPAKEEHNETDRR